MERIKNLRNEFVKLKKRKRAHFAQKPSCAWSVLLGANALVLRGYWNWLAIPIITRISISNPVYISLDC